MGTMSIFLKPNLLGIIAVGACAAMVFLYMMRNYFSLRNYAVWFGVSAAANAFGWAATLGFLGAFVYAVACGPMYIFGFLLTKELVKNTKIPYVPVRLAVKALCIAAIWFMAFFPFSVFAVSDRQKTPERNARQQEILRQRQKILAYETFADLTPIGLGVYKLQHSGDRYLWDVSRPEDYVIDNDGVYYVFATLSNIKSYSSWDHSIHSNKGKNVSYDVIPYEGTYIIAAPQWDTPRGSPGVWGFVYLCKEISPDADLFVLWNTDPDLVEALRALPGRETVSRRELAERLGKEF